jgi:hypothetical protein
MRSFRGVRGWLVLATLGLLLATLALSGAACPGTATKPQPTRFTRPAPRRVATRPAPTAPKSALTGAIARTKAAVTKGDWTTADRDAAAIGSAWQPIRTAKTWPAKDIAAFEAAYTKLRAAIKAKDRPAAERDLADLDRLAKKNTGVRPAPARTRGTRPMVRTAPRR